MTLRVRPNLPSFRHQIVHRLIVSVIRDQRRRLYKDEFRVIHFSINATDVELVIEADSERAMQKGYVAIRSGVSGFMIAVAKRLNGLLKRSGKVWADRYERKDLTSCADARAAVAALFRASDVDANPFSTSWLVRPGRNVVVPLASFWKWPVCVARTRIGVRIRGRTVPEQMPKRLATASRIKVWRRAPAHR